MKTLKDIIKQQDNEKKEITKKYEKNLKELTVRLNRLENNNKKPQITTLSSPKVNKLKKSGNGNLSKEKGVNRSRSKENVKKISSNSNVSNLNAGIKSLKKSPSLSGLGSFNYDMNNLKVGSPKSTKSSKSKKIVKKKKKNSSDKNILKMSHQSSTLSGLSPRGMLSPISSIGKIILIKFRKCKYSNFEFHEIPNK